MAQLVDEVGGGHRLRGGVGIGIRITATLPDGEILGLVTATTPLVPGDRVGARQRRGLIAGPGSSATSSSGPLKPGPNPFASRSNAWRLLTGIVAEYLKSRTVEEASVSAVFLSGKPFPAFEETTLQVGGRVLWQVVSEVSGKSEGELTAAYRRLGDLGAVAGEVLVGGANRAELRSAWADGGVCPYARGAGGGRPHAGGA